MGSSLTLNLNKAGELVSGSVCANFAHSQTEEHGMVRSTKLDALIRQQLRGLGYEF